MTEDTINKCLISFVTTVCENSYLFIYWLVFFFLKFKSYVELMLTADF